MKRILMIAYHFPPIQGSSGIHRTVQFARHLPKFGWEPMIVSVHPRAYPATGNDMYGGLSEKVIIRRAFAMDSARHLSFKGRYSGLTAIPDRWISWWPGGVLESLKLIRKYKPDVIWSTFPVATAHLIALTVHKLTGLPWIADLRDPMLQDNAPSSPIVRSVYQYLERRIVKKASCCVTVTKTAGEDYARRYPGKHHNFWQVIENGYDETLFEACESINENRDINSNDRPLKMVHSGLLYAEGRNPRPFLLALKSFLQKSKTKCEIYFRGCGDELNIQNRIADLGLQDIVKVVPPVPYKDAIEEMIQSDALIIFQGALFNKQIPAKVYEYVRAGKPILALTDQKGETAKFLKNWDGVYLGDMESPDSIEIALTQLVNDFHMNKTPARTPERVLVLSREAKTKELSGILDNLINT